MFMLLIKIFRAGNQHERKKFYGVLDGINNTGNISFEKFKEFVRKAQVTGSNSTCVFLLPSFSAV